MTTTLCITGMHRSGTSLTTSWLQQCGLVIDDGLLIDSDIGNQIGHFEDKDFVDFHAGIIETLTSPKSRWKIYTKKQLIFTDSQRLQAKQLVQARNSKYSVWGWKDPRTTFFMRQWKEIIPNLKILLLWRPAEQVIQSLLNRSNQVNKKKVNKNLQINLTEAINLWICHNEIICQYKEKYPEDTLLFSLESVINFDRNIIQLINQKLDIDLTYVPIKDLYNQKLLFKKSNFWLKSFLTFRPNIAKLENKLAEISDIR